MDSIPNVETPVHGAHGDKGTRSLRSVEQVLECEERLWLRNHTGEMRHVDCPDELLVRC